MDTLNQPAGKPRALVVFPDEWLAYSPTVLNLIDCLEPTHDVHLVAVDNGVFETPVGLHQLERVRDLKIVRFPRPLWRVLRRVGAYKALKLARLTWVSVRRALRRERFDLAIGVDSLGYLAARTVHPRPIFVSLEAIRDGYFRLARMLGVDTVAIQTSERFRYLFGESETRVSYLPNSPLDQRAPGPHRRSGDVLRLVYLGYIADYRGLNACVEALQLLGPSYELTIRGPSRGYADRLQAEQRDLIESGRLRYDPTYVPQSEVVDYLGGFDAGLCLYDLDLIAAGDFNYLSCPSGKVFNYFAAGIPVIGTDILGLRCVADHRAGVLISELSGGAIAAAVHRIEADYAGFAARSHQAAVHYDFRRAFDELMRATESSR